MAKETEYMIDELEKIGDIAANIVIAKYRFDMAKAISCYNTDREASLGYIVDAGALSIVIEALYKQLVQEK